MTKEDFKNNIKTLQSAADYKEPIAFGIGIRRSRNNTCLDVLYPVVNYGANYGTFALVSDIAGYKSNENGYAVLSVETLEKIDAAFEPFHGEMDAHDNTRVIRTVLNTAKAAASDTYADTDIVAFFLYNDKSTVASAEEAYFKLQCLSQRKVQPHGICLDGAFGALTNVAWTNYGPILPTDVETVRIEKAFSDRPLQVTHVDKFPYMLDYTIPSNTRVASTSQVRLGAYLGDGTTVMPAGYVNFNAGTAGNAMIEGRVSAGVFVGHGSDVGGGASIMGTLSGGNNNVVSIGERCLLGANAGTGISLGHGSTVAAGLYVYGGMKVSLYDGQRQPIDIDGNVVEKGQNIVKALELNGRENMLFLMDSTTGEVSCRPNKKAIELNAALHAND